MGEGEGKERDREGKKEGLFLLRRTDVPKGGGKGGRKSGKWEKKGRGREGRKQFNLPPT